MHENSNLRLLVGIRGTLAQPGENFVTAVSIADAVTGRSGGNFPDALHIRRFQTIVDETGSEAGRPLNTPILRVAVAAAITNPWAGQGYVADLQPLVQVICPPLAAAIMARIRQALGPDRRVEAFGKAVIVGAGGEVEHGAALVHNPFFSDVVRRSVGGTAVIASTEAIGTIGTCVHVPLCHITSAATRSHYQGMAVSVADAPHAGEVVVIVAVSTGPRGNARIGDCTTDAPFDAGRWVTP